MEYNTQREKMIIPEYGRHIQKMVEYCLTIKDREKRNEYAKTIIVAMGQVNPSNNQTANYQQKLWDHLFIISDYKLDVDSPYEKPTREQKDEKPSTLRYKNSKITYKTYGALLESLVKNVAQMPEGKEKKSLVNDLAQQMKKLYLQYNINTCDEQVLRNNLERLSNGRIILPADFQFKSNKELLGLNKKTNNNNNNNNKQAKAKNNKKK